MKKFDVLKKIMKLFDFSQKNNFLQKDDDNDVISFFICNKNMCYDDVVNKMKSTFDDVVFDGCNVEIKRDLYNIWTMITIKG